MARKIRQYAGRFKHVQIAGDTCNAMSQIEAKYTTPICSHSLTKQDIPDGSGVSILLPVPLLRDLVGLLPTGSGRDIFFRSHPDSESPLQ